MSAQYKVRMMVLALVPANSEYEATREAAQMVVDAGMNVLHVEEPKKVVAPPVFRDQGDIYP